MTKFTKAQLGKNYATRKGLKLNQDDGWPLVLVCADLGYKVSVEYIQKNNTFDVKVQDEPYLSLPYFAMNQNYGDE